MSESTAPQTSISIAASAMLYGRGVFTTASVIRGEPFLWDKHLRRLWQNAAVAGIDLSEFDRSDLTAAVRCEIEKAGLADGRIRVTLLDERPSPIWPGTLVRPTTMSILVGAQRTIHENLRLGMSKFTVNSSSPLAGVKSCSYLDKILTLDEAKSRGFDEAVQLNERGEITSAVMANIFWLKDEMLYTPSLATGCLAGTTREFVLENIRCTEIDAGIGALDSADAIYLTSAGIGIVSVGEFGSNKFLPRPHPILQLLTC